MAQLTIIPHDGYRLKSFPLRGRHTTIGTAGSCSLRLDSPGLADEHASLTNEGGRFSLRRLSRRAFLAVNGREVEECRLADRDLIVIGDTGAVFTLEPLAGGGDGTDGGATPADHYRTVLEFTAALTRTATPTEMLGTMLAGLIGMTAADNGFVVRHCPPHRPEVVAAHGIETDGLADGESGLSDSIVDTVIATRRPVLVSSAIDDEKFSRSRSVINLRLHSVICAPMIHRGELSGIVYLGSRRVSGLFDERALATLEILAAQAALLIESAREFELIRQQNRALEERIDGLSAIEIVGACDSMADVLRRVRRVAAIDVPVLVLGETGTGKELIARQIHAGSDRAGGPFVAVNCGAIPEKLLESEFFGYVRGAFTGADADRRGKLAAADGGTVLLDEIGDMPLSMQVKLLRVLDERKVMPVGSTRAVPVNIRVVAATNRDLPGMIERGEFREDLYYRLNVISLTLPPLRERGSDILLLAAWLLKKYAGEYNRAVRRFSERARDAMLSHAWPGNIREMQNRIKKAVILAERPVLEPADLDLRPEDARLATLAEARERFQMEYVLRALKLCSGNRTRAARMLDVDPRTIFRYLERMPGEGEA